MTDNKDALNSTAAELNSQGAVHSDNSEGKGRPVKLSRWSYERHIVKCPLCGKDVLDHMTECPFCKQEITIAGYKPMGESAIKTVKIAALIVGIIIAIVIIAPILTKRFGIG